MTESLGALTNERDNKYRKDVDRQERNKRKTKSRLCVSVDVERDYVVRCDGVSEQFSTCRQNGGAGQVVRRESSFCPPRSLYQVKKTNYQFVQSILYLFCWCCLFPSFCCRRGESKWVKGKNDQTREICFPSAWWWMRLCSESGGLEILLFI